MLEKLIVLGGGGWFPANGRHTASALLRDGDSAILIDAGTGVGRLVESPELLDGVEQLDILLTHFHLDHVVGLAYLPALGLSNRMTVWGPGRSLYEASTQELLTSMFHEPLHSVSLERQGIEIRDLPLGATELAGVRIDTRRQDRHSAPTLGYRFGDSFAWMTDTAHDPDAASFVAGCKMLAHEAWYTTEEPRNPDVHSSAAQAADIAERAGVERLLLIHVPPFEDDVSGLAVEAGAVVPDARVAVDGGDFSALIAP
jgi:ribonuclease BN (tRNA processing enzyme)